jgi:hypothetical protein
MHDPRMPFFDMDKPRVFYLEEAQECSKRYYDKTAKERTFLQGDKVMVYFPNAPPRINLNFFLTLGPIYSGADDGES